MVKVCEQGNAPVARGVVEGDLHRTELIVLAAADASQHVVCQPPLLAVPCKFLNA